VRTKLALTLSLMAARPASDLQVTLQDDRVVLRAAGAPLVEVLSRLSAATGARVVYEAARPRQPVSVVIEAATVAEAVTRLLEGQGLNYVLRLDPSGRNVEMLLIVGNSGAPAAAPAARPRSPSLPLPLPEEEAQPEAEEPFAPEEPEAPPEDATPPFPFPAAPGVGPAQEPPGAEPPGGFPVPQPGEPQPPGPASYPETAPSPTQPTYPEPASYPPPGD
jgi:hypothetical protein